MQANKLATMTFSEISFTLPSRYTGLKLLGAGSYGHVLLAMDNVAKQKVAIKKLHSAQDIVDAKRVLREIRILRLMKHEHIVPLLNCHYDSTVKDEEFGTVYLVQEYFPADLHKVIRNHKDLTDDHVQYIMYQLVKGIAYLHSAQIVHRDVKPSNILAKENCSVCLCDFGLARQLEDMEQEDDSKAQQFTEYVVTRYYRAPEVMVSSQNYSLPIDIWSLGCTFAELINEGQVLFKGKTYVQMVKLIFDILGKPTEDQLKEFITNKNALEFVDQLPAKEPTSIGKYINYPNAQAIDLLDKMLIINPCRRITAKEALQHPYFTEIREEEDEYVYKGNPDFDFEYDMTLTFDAVKKLILEEINEIKKGQKEQIEQLIDVNEELSRLKKIKEQRKEQKQQKQQKNQ